MKIVALISRPLLRHKMKTVPLISRFQTGSFHLCYFGTKSSQPDNMNVNDAIQMSKEILQVNPLPTIREVNYLLKNLVRLNEHSRAFALFKQMCNLGLEVDQATLAIAVNSFSRSNTRDYGFSLLPFFLKKGYSQIDSIFSASIFTPLVNGLFNDGRRVNEAHQLCIRMLRGELGHVDVVSYGTIINVICTTTNSVYGMSIFGTLYKKGEIANVVIYTTLLKAMLREDNVDEANRLLKKIILLKLCERNVVLYGTIIDGFCKLGQMRAALEVFMGMKKHGCDANTNILTMLIDGLIKYENNMDAALSLFESMPGRGLYPNVVTYNCIICGFCASGNLDKIEFFLKEMISRNMCPDATTFAAMIDGYCKVGQVTDAERILRFMEEREVVADAVPYGALIQGYCVKGQLDEAMRILHSMPSRNIQPNVTIYNILINGYCKQMKTERAWHLFVGMRRKGLKPDIVTYNSLLYGFSCSGSVPIIRLLLMEIRDGGLEANCFTFRNFLEGLCYSGCFETALALLDEHEECVSAVEILHYNIIMRGLCKKKRLDEAQDIFKGLTSKGLKPNTQTYNILIRGCCEGGLLEEAEELFSKMERASLSPDGETYNIIGRVHLMKGKYEDAARIIGQMLEKGFLTDVRTSKLLDQLPREIAHNPMFSEIIKKSHPVS